MIHRSSELDTVGACEPDLAGDLFDMHVEAVFNVAFRVVWNRMDAEDIAQSTFVKALTRSHQLEDFSKVRPWLLQIAYREAIAVLRRRRELVTDPADLPDTASTDRQPDEVVVAGEIARSIGLALASMKHDERLAVVLRDVEGLAMREVAAVLGVGCSAAKMRVHRGRITLRRLLLHKELVDAM